MESDQTQPDFAEIQGLESGSEGLFGVQLTRQARTHYALFAETILGSEYALPTVTEIADTVVSLPKSDTEHSWLAFEFCTVCLLNTFRDLKKEQLNGTSQHYTCFRIAFDIKDTLRRAWRAKLVSFWFSSSSFPNYYVGLLAYNVRLSMAPIPSDMQNEVRELKEIISREHSLVKIARRHREEIRRQKYQIENNIDSDIENVKPMDPSQRCKIDKRALAAHLAAVESKEPQSDNSPGSNTLSTRSNSLNSSDHTNGERSVTLEYKPSDLGDTSLMSRLTLLLQQISDGRGNPISDSTMAEVSSCLVALKSNKADGASAPPDDQAAS